MREVRSGIKSNELVEESCIAVCGATVNMARRFSPFLLHCRDCLLKVSNTEQKGGEAGRTDLRHFRNLSSSLFKPVESFIMPCFKTESIHQQVHPHPLLQERVKLSLYVFKRVHTHVVCLALLPLLFTFLRGDLRGRGSLGGVYL